MDATELLTIKQVQDITTLGRSSIYAFVKNGYFPKPFYLTPRKPRWTSGQIEGWIQERIDDRDNA